MRPLTPQKLWVAGWTVAVTSYRRAGLIVADAIRDVFNLRNYVCTGLMLRFWCRSFAFHQLETEWNLHRDWHSVLVLPRWALYGRGHCDAHCRETQRGSLVSGDLLSSDVLSFCLFMARNSSCNSPPMLDTRLTFCAGRVGDRCCVVGQGGRSAGCQFQSLLLCRQLTSVCG